MLYSHTVKLLRFMLQRQKAICMQHLSTISPLTKQTNGIVPLRAES